MLSIMKASTSISRVSYDFMDVFSPHTKSVREQSLNRYCVLRVSGRLRFATRRLYSLRLPSEVENNEPNEPRFASTLAAVGKSAF